MPEIRADDAQMWIGGVAVTTGPIRFTVEDEQPDPDTYTFKALQDVSVTLTTYPTRRQFERLWEIAAPGTGPAASRMRADYRRRQLARRRRNRK